jgi:hypothetical protein
MTRTITFRDYPDATGAPVCEMIVKYSLPAARLAGAALIKAQPADAAYLPTPFGHAGEPFDPEEPWPSDATAITLPPPCDGNNAGEALAQAQHEAALDGDGCTSGACLLTRGSD